MGTDNGAKDDSKALVSTSKGDKTGGVYGHEVENYLLAAATNLIGGPILAFKVLARAGFFGLKYAKGREFNEHTGRELDLVTGHDSHWTQSRPEDRTTSAAIFWLRGELDVEEFATKFATKVVFARDHEARTKYSRFLEYVVCLMGFYYWKREKKFDIKEHVKQLEEKVKDEADLKKLVARLLNNTLDPEKAPWMIHHVKFETGGRSALIFVYDNTILDGTRLAFLVANELADEVPPEDANNNSLLHVDCSLMTRGKFQLIPIMKKLFFIPYEYFAQNLHVEVSPLMSNKTSGQRVVSWSENVSVDLLLRIAQEADSTGIDVAFAALAGTFKKFLQKNNMVLPPSLRLALTVCRQRRQKPNFKSAKFSSLMVDLPLDRETKRDTIKTLNEYFAYMSSSSLFIEFNDWMNFASANTFPQRMFHRFERNMEASLVASTIVAPATQVSMCGCVLENAAMVGMYRGKAGGSVSIMTYNGSLRLGVAMDTSIVSDVKLLDAMMEDLQTEVAEMADELKVQHQASK